ncbi:ShlB/FhaC/HecB family hemolysin secretion/activation protein [Burkholderia orbicola]|uniref:ShlB/FhaC/HecB family hemolysin secretion/activation protein n=1 Tax=Burkholderia orbicola TaxID=2978683 RepID=UPI002FE11FF7
MRILGAHGQRMGSVVLAVGGLVITSKGWAQTLPPVSVPNAGSILQQKKAESRQREEMEGSSSSPAMIQPMEEVHYKINSIEFSGNSKLGTSELTSLVGRYVGKDVTRHDLDEIAAQISNAYREHGYGFTFTSVDLREGRDGKIKFIIVEGRAGNIKLNNHSRVRRGVLEGMLRHFREHPESTDNLERSQWLISDIPGVGGVLPRLTRGSENGVVDVEIEVQDAPLISGYMSLDNYGSRTSGRTRLNLVAGLNSPFGLGDALRINISGFPFGQSGHSTLGGFTYDFPIGKEGVRGGFGYNRMQYNLGGSYEGQFDGTADVWSAYVGYPIMRQPKMSVVARVAYNHNIYKDNQVGFENQRISDSMAVSVYGNTQDVLWGRGGGSRMSLTLTYGNLRYNNPLFAEQDASGSKTAGGYGKIEMSVSRTQQLTTATYLHGEVTVQYGFKNLDGSARMVMGGPSAVRAFSSDFVSVDTGILARGTAGWRLPLTTQVNVFAFYDVATGVLRHSPKNGQQNNINLHGAGVGMEVSYRAVTASVSFATRVGGSAPAIGDQPKNWTWLSLAYSF